MSEPLRVLIIEDSEDDADLLLLELRRGGYKPQFQRVDNAADLDAALDGHGWDLVITDHNLPGFSSTAALATVKRAGLDVPVIIVSGSIGEDVAVAAMKEGAHDYIMKDNLVRLVPAVGRELREAKTRHAHRRAQETIQRLALHDALTGLLNRHEFEVRVKQAIGATHDGQHHALLYLDLDQFKIINDTCGHTAGDALLRQLAVLLRGPIRDEDTLARLGGDEFGILLCGCSTAHAKHVAERVLHIIKHFRYTWKQKSFNIGASIGLVMLEDPNQTLSDILRDADMACYAAKENGRNRVHVYHNDDVELRRRHGEMEWIARLNRALEENRFALYSQSIVPLGRGGSMHHEFLLRLRGDDDEMIPPGAFIPAAERYNLMPNLDRWVVRHALAYLAQRYDGAAIDEVFFINLSGATLSDGEFTVFVTRQLELHGLPPAAIGFEITETAVISNLASALDFIRQVKELGCRVALDDFGSGLSSFSYLKTIPADYLKIDGSFILDMLDDPMDAAIVDAINRVGHVAGLKTVAEFVESEAVKQKLIEIGVDYAQGFVIHKPESLDVGRNENYAAEGP